MYKVGKLFHKLFSLSYMRLSLLMVGLFLLLTLFAVFDSNHLFKNLEPYPDGILYIVQAHNLLHSSIQIPSDVWIQPVYSSFLAIGFIFSQNPYNYYFINVLLGAMSVILLTLIFQNKFLSKRATLLGVLTYLSFPVIYILTSVPMAENAMMTLFLFSVWGLTHSERHFKVFGTFGAIGLGLTKLSVSITAAVLVVLGTLQIIWVENAKKRAVLLACAGLILMLLGFFLRVQNLTVWQILFQLTQKIVAGTEYYSAGYVLPNAKFYLFALLGKSSPFLWYEVRVGNVFLIFLMAYSVLRLVKQRQFEMFSTLILLIASIFILPLIFYVQDVRFILLLIPIYALSVGWITDQMRSKRRQFLVVGVVLFSVCLQLSGFKSIVTTNLLGRTSAWQYEAVLHIHDNLHSNENVITALPPQLIYLRDMNASEPMPLSRSQEFIQRDEWVWNSKEVGDIPLIEYYRNLLESGETLYITNAYITHQQSVIEDYEAYKEVFEFELVSEGCEQACNIYRLSLPEEPAQK